MPITTEQILIEFIGDASKMEPAIDALEKVGVVDKAQAENFKKVNAEYENRAKAINKNTEATKKSNDENTKAIKGLDDLSKKLSTLGKDGLKSGLGQIEQGIQEGIIDALNEAGLTVDEFTGKLVSVPGKTDSANKSLKAQLRELKEEISALDDAGQSESKQFEDLSVKAAKLEDQIGDTGARIRALASDTRQLDTLVASVRGIAAAFALSQGAMGLFGKENEDVQNALLKVNSAMAILQGLTELQTLAQKENIAVQSVSILQRRAQVVAVQLETVAESNNIVVKGAATVAQWLLNAAMNANPGVLLLSAIVAISTALVVFSSKSNDAAEAQNKLNVAQKDNLDTLEKLNKATEQFNKAQTADAQQALDIANAQNRPLKERLDLEKQLLISKLAQAAQSKAFYGPELDNLGANIDKLDVLKSQYEILNRQKADKEVLDAKKGEIDNLQREVDLVKGISDAYLQANKELAVFNESSQRQLNEEALKNAVTVAETKAVLAADGSKKELEAQKKVLIEKSQLEIFNASENAAKIANIKANLVRDLEKLDNDYEIRLLEDKKASDQAILEQTKISGQNQLAIKIKLIEDQRAVDLKNATLTETQRVRINAAADAEIYLLRVAAAEKEVDAAFELEKADAERRLFLAKEGSAARVQASKDLLSIEEDQAILSIKNSQDSEELKQTKIAAIQAKYRAEREKLDTDAAEKLAAKEKQIIDQKAKYELQIRDQVIGFVFDQGQAIFDRNLTNSITGLNKQKEAELSNKKLTEEQKLKIEEKYRAEEARIRNEAAKRQRAADLIIATVNGYLAVSAVLADKTIPTLVKPIAIAQAVIANALQIAAIAATPLPRYRYGVEKLEGPGTTTSDSITARLSKGERVVPADVNNDYFTALSAIHNRKVSPAVANAIMSGGLPPANVEKAMMKSLSIHAGGVNFDEKKFAKIVAAEMLDMFNQMSGSQVKATKYLRDIAENTKSVNSSTYDYHRR